MIEALDTMLELADNRVDRFAKIVRKYYNALLKEGFTSEQAVELLKNFRPGGGKT